MSKKEAVTAAIETTENEINEERQPVRFTRAQHAALVIQVSLKNNQIPESTVEKKVDDSDLTVQQLMKENPLLTAEIAAALQDKKCLDENNMPTKLGVALVLRNLSQGVNFDKMILRLNRKAKTALLFTLVESLTKDIGEAGIKYYAKDGQRNKFWTDFADMVDRLDLLLETEPK